MCPFFSCIYTIFFTHNKQFSYFFCRESSSWFWNEFTTWRRHTVLKTDAHTIRSGDVEYNIIWVTVWWWPPHLWDETTTVWRHWFIRSRGLHTRGIDRQSRFYITQYNNNNMANSILYIKMLNLWKTNFYP